VEADGLTISDEPGQRTPKPVLLPRRARLDAPAIAVLAVIVAAAVAGLIGVAGMPRAESGGAVDPAAPPAVQSTIGPGGYADTWGADDAPLIHLAGPYADWTRVPNGTGASFELPPGWTVSQRNDSDGSPQTYLQDSQGVLQAALFQGTGNINICAPGGGWVQLDSAPLVSPLLSTPVPAGQGSMPPAKVNLWMSAHQSPAHVNLWMSAHQSGPVHVLATVSNDPPGRVDCASMSAAAGPADGAGEMPYVAFTTGYPLGQADPDGRTAVDTGQYQSQVDAEAYAATTGYALLRRAMSSLVYSPQLQAASGAEDCRIGRIAATREVFGITTGMLSYHPEYFTLLGCAGGWLAFEASVEGYHHIQAPAGGLLYFFARRDGSSWTFDPGQDSAVLDGWQSAAISGPDATPAGLTVQQRMDAQFAAAGIPAALRPALVGPGPG
jgi:hypothetical protein